MGGIFFAHLPEGSAFDPEAEIKKVLGEVAMSRERSEPNVVPPRQSWRDSTIQEENNHFPKGRWQWRSRPDSVDRPLHHQLSDCMREREGVMRARKVGGPECGKGKGQ